VKLKGSRAYSGVKDLFRSEGPPLNGIQNKEKTQRKKESKDYYEKRTAAKSKQLI